MSDHECKSKYSSAPLWFKPGTSFLVSYTPHILTVSILSWNEYWLFFHTLIDFICQSKRYKPLLCLLCIMGAVLVISHLLSSAMTVNDKGLPFAEQMLIWNRFTGHSDGQNLNKSPPLTQGGHRGELNLGILGSVSFFSPHRQ